MPGAGGRSRKSPLPKRCAKTVSDRISTGRSGLIIVYKKPEGAAVAAVILVDDAPEIAAAVAVSPNPHVKGRLRGGRGCVSRLDAIGTADTEGRAKTARHYLLPNNRCNPCADSRQRPARCIEIE